MLPRRSKRTRYFAGDSCGEKEKEVHKRRPVIKDPVALAKALLAVDDDGADCSPRRRGRPKSLQPNIQPSTSMEAIVKAEKDEEENPLLQAASIFCDNEDKPPVIQEKRRRGRPPNHTRKTDWSSQIVLEESIDEKPDPRALAAALLAMPDDSVEAVPQIKMFRARKRKLSPEEKMLLAQLHHDFFLIYHSKRYLGPDYIDGPLNLKAWILQDWSRRLTELGICERSPIDVANRINEMIIEVAEYRQQTNFTYKLQMANYQMSPSFLLINKVYEYLTVTFDRVEEILDKYEAKVAFEEEEALIREWKTKGTVEWTEEEKEALVDLFSANAWIYSVLPIRKKDHIAKDALLRSWSIQISNLGIERSPAEVEAKICEYRHKHRTSLMTNDRNQQRSESPTGEALYTGFEYSENIDFSWDRDAVFKAVKQIQEEILREKIEVTETIPGMYDPLINSCRSNRPHMSKREKHLLGLLYRKNHEDYETYNHPHRKGLKKKKWEMLKEWAATLSSLGVSMREPEELATKISQYKNIVKTHKQCMKGGIESLTFKNEYKMRRCLRPLSPTTQLFDVTDCLFDENQFTDDAIAKYVKESQDIRFYPYSSMFDKNTTDEDASHSKDVSGVTSRQLMLQIVTGVLNQPSIASTSDDIGSTVASVANGGNNEAVMEDCINNDIVKTEPMDEDLSMFNRTLSAQKEEEESKFRQDFEKVFNDCKTMDRLGLSMVTYDCIDPSGHVSQMAVSREENERDVNYFIWNKYMELETEHPVTFYVCYMCEQMATPSAVDGRKVRFPPFVSSYIPNGALLAQQSLPTVALTSDHKRANISWAKSAPKHRCVPFLMSTMCERMAGFNQTLIRTTVFESVTLGHEELDRVEKE